VDAQQLSKLLSKQLFTRVVAVNELVLVSIDSLALVVRISSVNTLDEAARDEALTYHCYRGLVTPDTEVYLKKGNKAQQHPVLAACGCYSGCYGYSGDPG